MSTSVARGSEVAYRGIYASLNGALGLDDVELLSAKQIQLTCRKVVFASGVLVGISNFRYMVGF